MTSSTPKPPYAVCPARVDAGPIFLITDANDQIITSAFEAPLAGFVAGKLNHRCDDGGQNGRSYNDLLRANPVVAAMLGAFRLHLEHENGGPLTDEPTIPLLLAELCDWFSFSTGEKAIALGREMLVYVNRLDGERMTADDRQRTTDNEIASPLRGSQ